MSVQIFQKRTDKSRSVHSISSFQWSGISFSLLDLLQSYTMFTLTYYDHSPCQISLATFHYPFWSSFAAFWLIPCHIFISFTCTNYGVCYVNNKAKGAGDSWCLTVSVGTSLSVLPEAWEREKEKESTEGSRQRGTGIQGNMLFLIIAAFHKGTGDSSILQHSGSPGSRRASRSHSHIPLSTQTNRGSHTLVTTLLCLYYFICGLLITLTSPTLGLDI